MRQVAAANLDGCIFVEWVKHMERITRGGSKRGSGVDAASTVYAGPVVSVGA
jgi:hypothetical protein